MVFTKLAQLFCFKTYNAFWIYRLIFPSTKIYSREIRSEHAATRLQ